MTSRGLKAKHQRLIMAVAAILVLLAAVLLGIWGLRSQASYFFVPSEIVATPPAPDRAVRLGGMVEAGSVQRLPDGITLAFVVGDGNARVPVRFAGIVPDLFREGSGVVAEGRMRPDGTFVADNLLAKHDERYVPRELQDMTDEQARATVAGTRK